MHPCTRLYGEIRRVLPPFCHTVAPRTRQPKHDQLLTQEGVFGDSLHFPSSKVEGGTARKTRVRWAGPGDEASLEHLTGRSHEPVDAVCTMDHS